MIDLTEPTIVDNYRLEQQLYASEASQVWRAHDLTNEKPVVIKCMQVSLVDDPNLVQRFRQRLALVRDMGHPHIITIHSYDNQDGDWYVVMEYMADHSLRAVINQRAHDPQVWPLARVLDLVRQAAIGLEHAHARNVLHLNLKPSNLLLTRRDRLQKPLDYTLKISDFGLVSHIGANTRLRESLSPDTLAHLSPEQFQHQQLDGRSDIYALGVVLYELVTGHLPFETKSFNAAVTNHVHTSPLAPRLACPNLNLSPKLEQLIMRCLAKQPDERVATMADLSQALQEIVLDLASSPASVMSAPVSTANAPRIWALRQGQAVWGHTLTGNGLTIGRIPHDNDGVLDAEGVADHHLQIDWDGMRVSVTDLTAGGKNETTRAWAWRTTLPVGPFSLLLEPPATATDAANGMSMPASSATPDPAAPSAASARSKTRSTKHIKISSEQSNPLDITPGQSVPPITIMLNNTGKRPDHITVMVNGKLANTETHIPVKMVKDAVKKLEAAVRIDPPRVHIYQRDSQPVTLNITAPRDPLLLAGTYAINICANSLNNQEDAGTTHALAGHMQTTWQVQPFLASDLKVTPQVRGWRKGVYKVDLTNKGNAPADYALSVSNADEDELRFHFTPSTFTLNPGKSHRARLRVNPRQWRWFGNAHDVQQHTFTVTSEGQLDRREMIEEPDTRTAQCRFKQHALFPRWFPRVLLFLLLAALASGFLLHGCNRGPVAGQALFGTQAGWMLSATPTPTMTATSTAIPTATATRTIPPTSTPIPPPTPLPPTPLPPTPTSTPAATPTATATMTPTPLPYDEVCVPGREIIIAGSGPSQASLLAYFDLVPENQFTRGERAVGGGSTNQTGQFAIPLRIAPRTPPGIYTVTIRIRGTNEIVQQILCLVPDPSTPTPSPAMDTPTPTQ